MKSSYFTNIVIEGADGVGKTTLYTYLLYYYKYRLCVYDRGEFSNLVYAKKYNRLFSSSQRGFPILYILLTCDKKVLKERLSSRNYDSDEEKNLELLKINDQDLFLEYLPSFSKDYHIIVIDTTNLDAEGVFKEAVRRIEEYHEKLTVDDTLTPWNKVYKEQCDKLGLKFKVINNQPFINNKPIMVEPNLHNGIYETFIDKSVPHNLIYAQQYSDNLDLTPFEERKYDFSYIINSKVLTRPEIYDYFSEFNKNNISCLIGAKEFVAYNPLFKNCGKVFGDDFIKLNATAKATLYLGRNIAYLKNLSVRLYEGIIAKQIVFVDKKSDPDNEILTRIHMDEYIENLLYVDEKSIIQNYKFILDHPDVRKKIIENQTKYYNSLKNVILSKIKEEGIK